MEGENFELFDVSALLSKFSQGSIMREDVEYYWKNIVPCILSPTAKCFSLENTNKDELVKQYLLKPLEDFICKFERPDLQQYLLDIEKMPPLCGKLFKLGEPTYTCRECSMDSTCVLCVDCFINSNHKHHKYKMRTSGGGGCCDCGDVEAWKSEPCCNDHNVSARSIEPPPVPNDFMDRVKFIFHTVLSYAFGLLTMENLNLPSKWSDNQDECMDSDSYCTVLYNDEIHTFEQVITSLSRVIKCSQRDAIEYVTNIDREGRAIVKCSTYRVCSDLKLDIERFTSRHGTKPLKVLVIQSKLLAHQAFAMKLLTWLQNVLRPSVRLRKLFAAIVMVKKQDLDLPVLEGILIRDSCLWKSARLNWHRLFITGMLIDYDNKKAFATTFTKHYNVIIKDFINDDHEHSYSVASLSIQIFTVPTLAHYLIENEDILFLIMNVFLSECSRKCNRNGKLEFERNALNSKFKRAIYALYDIKYLLGSVPSKFNDSLRKGFFPGFASIITLLNNMQGMDCVTRQIGQHMEYEPEWESAFNLHLKLAPIISLLLKWCSADHYLLARSFRLILKFLLDEMVKNEQENTDANVITPHMVYNAPVVKYDVASKPVSIHLPLSRFLAGLALNLRKFNLQYCDLASNKIRSWEIIEPVLRTRVMIAQVHAGMWRRNGYSLSNQIYFYNNVKCRGEMLDKDIVMLQLGATLMPNDDFIVVLLDKFNLKTWAEIDFETSPMRCTEDDTMRQIIHLVEEFLLLLITIVGERYVPGVGNVTEADCLKNEIIQQLCIKPLSHSELDKTLPDDINHETGMEDVISEIALFKKPNPSSQKGVYELKPQFFEKYNVFFYHFTREELSKSEEAQRKYNKTTFSLECCPPPKLPNFTDNFVKVSSLLTSDLLLYIMKIILERSLDYCARSFSEPQVHKVLHLIGYALNGEEDGQLSESFTLKATHKDINLPLLLHKLLSNPRVEAHKDLVKWTIQKFCTVSKKHTNDPTVSFQGSYSEGEEKDSRSKLAAERKAKIMAQMAAMQKNFMKDNAHLFTEDMSPSDSSTSVAPSDEHVNRIALGPDQTPVAVTTKSYVCILCQEEQEVTASGLALVYAAYVQKSTVLSRNRSLPPPFIKKSENIFLTPNIGPGPHASTCGHVMHRLCWMRYYDNVVGKENRRPYRHRQPSSFDVEKHEYLCPLCECLSNTTIPILPMLASLPNLSLEERLRQCNFSEWINASLEAVKSFRENSKFIATTDEDSNQSNASEVAVAVRREPINIDIIPMLLVSPSVSSDDDDDMPDAGPSCVTEETPPVNPNSQEPSSGSGGADDKKKDSKDKEDQVRVLSQDLIDMVLTYAQYVCHKLGSVFQMDESSVVPLQAWQSCAYTIRTLEQYLRVNNKPLFGDLSSRQKDILESLVRVSGVLGCAWKEDYVINHESAKLFLKIVDNNRDDNYPCLLDWDSFCVLVQLICSFPSMFSVYPVPVPTGTNLELHIFMVLLYSMIAQIMYVIEYPFEDANEISTSNDDTSCLYKFMKIINKHKYSNTDQIWEHIKKELMPFLRCCALFFHFLTDVPPPEEWKTYDGDTFESLCSYLGVSSSCKELLDNSGFTDLLNTWADQLFAIEQGGLEIKKKVLRNLTQCSSLVPLPDDYSELINNVSSFTCPSSDREDSRNPTMCLVCGKILCSQTYCCQTEINRLLVGACNSHAHTCGAGGGIFLRIRECEILLLSTPSRGTFITPPYLDEYGEPDAGLTRGNPLKLSHEKYNRINMMWLSHSIYEEIARAIETTNTPLNTQWQHL